MDSSTLSNTETYNEFFKPSTEGLQHCKSYRDCPTLSDKQWIEMGVCRSLFESTSGRAFLQQYNPLFKNQTKCGHFFHTLKSSRRLKFCQELNQYLCTEVTNKLPDSLAQFEELQGFDIYAGDGHWNQPSTHEPTQDGRKWAAGHFYTLDLRNHRALHLEMADDIGRKHEHDMRALKRQSIQTLRQNAPKGRRVLYVWDSACLGFEQWEYWKQIGGIYFVTRAKENLLCAVVETREVDQQLPINAGIIKDEIVMPEGKIRFRRIQCVDPATGKLHILITNQMTLSPGLLAQLYRIRWDIEKVFDQFKNSFLEKKAWAGSRTAKIMQANFLCMAHNLLLLMHGMLELEHGIQNIAEKSRKDKRLRAMVKIAHAANRTVSSFYFSLQRLTKHSLKFIRSLRTYFFLDDPLSKAAAYLKDLYATL